MRTNFFYFHKKLHKDILRIIAPDVSLLKNINEALLCVRRVDRAEYRKLFFRLNTVFVTNVYGYANEFFMPEKIWFTNKSLIKNNDVLWLASLLVHEAYHATQFKDGAYVLPLGEQLERPALRIQMRFLRKAQRKLFGKQNVEARDSETVLTGKYWEEMNGDARSFIYFRNLLDLLESEKIQLRKVKV